MKVGGVELAGGKIVDLTIDSVSIPPTFDPSDKGEFTLSDSDGVLRFNTGSGLVSLTSSVSENPNLIESLGSEWLNSDLSFNPVPFNSLPILSGLTNTDSLYNVIVQITEAIEDQSTVDTTQLLAPPGTADLNVLAHLGGDVLFLPFEVIVAGSSITLDFNNLEGFDIGRNDDIQGNMLVFNDVGNLVSVNVSYTYTNFTANATHVVNHNLNEKYVSVFCIDPSTDEWIQPDSISYITENQLLITLDSSRPLIANVTNFSHDS
jgi:hypothetical protein